MNRRPSQSRSGYDSFSTRHHAHFRAAQPDSQLFEPQKKRRTGLRALGAALLILLAVLAVNTVSNQFVRVSRVTVPIRGMSEAFDGYTILHISDLKGARFGQNQDMLRFALKDAAFDAVALTGDMVSARGNAQPLYALIDVLRDIAPDAPIYFIPGDGDPMPTSMRYAAGGSPFAPWVLGAQQRGATLLSSPARVEREEQALWLTTSALLSLDMDTMQEQFERQYLNAQDAGDPCEIELTTYNLYWLENTRAARKAMQPDDVYVALTHVPPADDELLSPPADSLRGRVHLVLCGHYLGGLLRLPAAGALFMPSKNLPRYGLLPGPDTYCGLARKGRSYLYVSPGLGENDGLYPAPFFRFLNPPTVTLVSLTPSSL